MMLLMPTACGNLTDGSFSGAIQVTCDPNIALANPPTIAAMADSAIPSIAAFVLQDPGNAANQLSVYQVFAAPPGDGSSTVAVTLNPNSASIEQCSPCIVATFAGKSYIPRAGALQIDLSAGTTGTMAVTLTNAIFTPADGVGYAWCIPAMKAAQSFGAYECSLVGASNGCVSLPETSASVTCTGDTMAVVQNCTDDSKTCDVGTCR